MIDDMSRVRLYATACALLVGSVGASGAAEVSRWDGDARSAVRVIAGSQSKSDAAVLRAGVELRIKPGWHTYWRYPGDAGVPPQFDFKSSANVKSVEVLWPAPERLAEAGGISIGYSRDVIFPLRIVPQDKARPVTLRLSLDYAVCEKLCVPAAAKVELELPKGSTQQDAAIADAEARVPKRVALGEGDALSIRSVRREAGAERSRVTVDLVVKPDQPVNLFVEGPAPDWALPVPAPADGAPPGHQRFVFDLDGLPPGASDKGARLTMTAVTDDRAIEVAIHLD